MPFVRRDGSGRIEGLFREREPSAGEYLPPDHAEVRRFIGAEPALGPELGDLARTDLEMIRVYEDLVELLVAKKIVLLTDLPAPAQAKLLRRRKLRGALADLTGIIADDAAEELP